MAKKKPIKENALVPIVKKLFGALAANSFVTKIHVSAMHNYGFPDMIAICEGITFYLELKAPGKKPTALQEGTLLKIQDAGARSYVVDCATDNKHILNFRHPASMVNIFEVDTKNPLAISNFWTRISGEDYDS